MTKYAGNAETIGFEANNLTVSELEKLQQLIKNSDVKPIDELPLKLRVIKDETEIHKIKKAITITQKTLDWVQKYTTHKRALGISEVELKNQVDQALIQAGATATAFPTIVAFDDHTALPHHQPTSRKLKPNSIILIDLGAQYHLYNADMTRTWCLGTPPPKFKAIEAIINAAYHAAAAKTTTDTPCNQIDKAARDLITAKGYGKHFIHSVGHGVGLEAHEPESLTPQNTHALASNMVITIEPGIYLPNHFGFRFENTLIVP
jgi:Xaa-Pro aminopeptidase